ncbi:MAG: sodium:solute symporter family protein [Thermodesulfobacteriota bacterium]|nr:sodium:solute symporter family protein [Thermodesulfobacteriota bacterium]
MNIAIVSTFFLVMLIVGILSMKKIKDPASYYVADRKGNTAAITGSLLATTIGGSSTIGLAGLGYSKGLVGAWWLLVGVVGLFILSFWLAEKVRNYKVYTLPEILEKQYGGNTIKIAASLLISVAWLGIISAQIIAAGKILSVLWPGQTTLLMIIAASVFIVYTVLGGQYSILRTDFIQSLIIITGIIICLAAGVHSAGGLTVMAGRLPESCFSFPVSVSFSWIDLFTFLFFVGATYLVGPDIYSRILCSKNSRIAKRSIMMAAVALIPVAFFITLIGMTARVILPGIPPENAFPSLIIRVLPAGLSGLVIAALLAAVMSSADTCLLTTSTIVSADIIDPLFRSKMGGISLLIISRICVVAIGIVSLFIALKVKGIIVSLLLGYTVYSSGLIIPIILGFYKNRLKLNAFGAILAVIGGGGLGLYLKLSGYNDLLLLALPISALLLIAGSRVGNAISCKKAELNGV